MLRQQCGCLRILNMTNSNGDYSLCIMLESSPLFWKFLEVRARYFWKCTNLERSDLSYTMKTASGQSLIGRS